LDGTLALELTAEGVQFAQQRIELVQNKLVSEETLKQSGEKAQAYTAKKGL
jgi:hypothetical protein